MSKHKHVFVPVEVTWKSYWDKIHDDIPPIPVHVVSACTCGEVKLTKARMVEDEKR